MLAKLKEKVASIGKSESKEEKGEGKGEGKGEEEGEQAESYPPLYLTEVFGSLFGQNKFADVIFTVGGKKFPAHRIVLAAASPLFELMLYKLGPEGQPSLAIESPVQITINGVKPEIFQQLLKCIYTDEAEVDSSNIQELMAVAGKYQVEKLKATCAEFMEADVNVDNALDLFSIAPTLLGDQEFGMEFIEENVEAIFEKDAFVRLPKDRLMVLLKSDKLACDEVVVYKAVQRWVKEQEKKEGFEKECC
jgi:hypothetical protein